MCLLLWLVQSGDVSLQTHMGAKVRQARAEEADRMRHKHG